MSLSTICRLLYATARSHVSPGTQMLQYAVDYVPCFVLLDADGAHELVNALLDCRLTQP